MSQLENAQYRGEASDAISKVLIFELDSFSGRVEHFLLKVVFGQLTRRGFVALSTMAKLTSLVRSIILLWNAGYTNPAKGLIYLAVSTSVSYFSIAGEDDNIDLRNDIFAYEEFENRKQLISIFGGALGENKQNVERSEDRLKELEAERIEAEIYIKSEYSLLEIPKPPALDESAVKFLGSTVAAIYLSLQSNVSADSGSLRNFMKESGEGVEFPPRSLSSAAMLEAPLLFSVYLNTLKILLEREFPENPPEELHEAYTRFESIYSQLTTRLSGLLPHQPS